jgi:two-component system alkaline phosphatase synthesis response regulator PhoP
VKTGIPASITFSLNDMTSNTNNIELTGKNIVIVEDDPSLSKYYQALLRNTGADVRIFHTGKEFVDYVLIKDNAIDFVIMDFLIPLVNGIECIRILRRERKNIPAIMITAYYSEEAKAESFIAGCNEYLLKPIYPEKVLFIIEKYLKSKIRVHFPK